jgi:hypothetical protein
VAHARWGSTTVGVIEEQREREGFWQGGLGLLLSLRCQLDRTRGKGFSRFLDSRERSPADPLLSLWLA